MGYRNEIDSLCGRFPHFLYMQDLPTEIYYIMYFIVDRPPKRSNLLSAENLPRPMVAR